MGDIHVGDVGTVLEVLIVDETGAAANISTASLKDIYLKKPGRNGEVLTKAGVFVTNGTDGLIKYTTIASDLTDPGLWTIQGYVELAAGQKWHSDEGTFRVEDNLA